MENNYSISSFTKNNYPLCEENRKTIVNLIDKKTIHLMCIHYFKEIFINATIQLKFMKNLLKKSK
jgi:hypothetical protein